LAERAVIHRNWHAIGRNPVFLGGGAMYLHAILSTGANVKPETSYEWRRQLMWGVVLIASGTAIFLEQMDLVEMRSLWHYWPLLLVVFGINKMIGYPTAKHFTDGLWTMLMGLWIFAVFEDMFGLTFGNSWPFVIIASGVCMILQPVIKKRFAPNEELSHEK
jgi:hypothetical protein